MESSPEGLELVLLVNDLSGGTYGNQANRLALGLAKDPRCHTTLLGYGGQRVPWLPDNVTTELMPTARALATGPNLVRYLVEHQPHVLVTRQVHMNLLAVVAAGLARRRGWRGHLVIGHDHPVALSHRENRRDNMYLARLLYPKADLVAAVSPTVADDAISGCRVHPECVIQLPNVIDGYSPGPPPPHPWLAEDRRVFVSVARLVKYKRFDLLIDALKTIEDARLLIVGRGPAHDAIEAHVRRCRLGDRVQLLGFVEDPRRYMQHCTGFVLASEEEGFSQVLIEAMSTGCPIITTDAAGGGPRFVTDNGRFGALVPRGDTRGLARAMRALLDAGVRQEWSELASERAVAFTPEACARQLVDQLMANGFTAPRR